jgi:hypothetical protein
MRDGLPTGVLLWKLLPAVDTCVCFVGQEAVVWPKTTAVHIWVHYACMQCTRCQCLVAALKCLM